jgi:hypothetical protein
MKKNLQLNSLTQPLYNLVEEPSLSAFYSIALGMWMSL